MVHLHPEDKFNYSNLLEHRICFGAIPSRRLGRSLGIDILPKKTCNLNCIYCELGENEYYSTYIKEYINVDLIKNEIKKQIESKIPFDTLTITASGEPTLHSKLGEIIEYSKDLTDKPIALLTNATLFSIPEIRQNVKGARIILPSLDAASEEVFRKINRPHKNLKIDDIIKGLVELREEYDGLMWLEILFVEGVNDHEEELILLKKACDMIAPDKVQINTVVRPPAVNWAKPVSQEKLNYIKTFLGNKAEIIVDVKSKTEVLRDSVDASLLLEALKRRPLRFYDIELMFHVRKDVLARELDKLSKQGKIVSRLFNGELFYFYSC